MLADKIISFAAIGHRAFGHILIGPVVADKIEHSGIKIMQYKNTTCINKVDKWINKGL